MTYNPLATEQRAKDGLPMTRTEIAEALLKIPDHVCCSCCAGYCDQGIWEDLVRVTASDGNTYAGSRHMLLLADLLDLPSDQYVAEANGVTLPEVPDDAPPFAGRLMALMWDRLDHAGLEPRGTDDHVALHLDGRRVGVARAARPPYGLTRDEMAQVREVAGRALVPIDAAQRFIEWMRGDR